MEQIHCWTCHEDAHGSTEDASHPRSVKTTFTLRVEFPLTGRELIGMWGLNAPVCLRWDDSEDACLDPPTIPILPSHHPLDAPHPDLCPHHCRPHSSVLSLVLSIQNHSSPFIEPCSKSLPFPSTQTICVSRNPFHPA